MKAELIYLLSGQIWVATFVTTGKWYCLVWGMILMGFGIMVEYANKK